MRGNPMLLQSLPLDETILSTFMNPFSLQCLTWIVHWVIDCNTSCYSIECVFSIVMRLRTTSRETVSSSSRDTTALVNFLLFPRSRITTLSKFMSDSVISVSFVFYCCPLFLLEGDYSEPLSSSDMNKRFKLLNGIDASPFCAIRFDV